MQKQRIYLTIIFSLTLSLTMAQQNTNDLYDDSETYPLKGAMTIRVEGEVSRPGEIDLSGLPLRSVIVKETLLSGDTSRFTGAYRYDGYSLYDILNTFLPDKKNQEEFPPIIDLYVTVENISGESVVFSWGEIYYPIHRHEIIIATKVARIVPSKTKDLWPLPESIRLVAGPDLLTERNISDPVQITVHSAAKSFPVKRDLSPLYAPEITVNHNSEPLGKISGELIDAGRLHYESIFYGRGRGIHSTTPFEGPMLKALLAPELNVDREVLRKGFMIVSAADGYRAMFSCSEVFNRNDQAEVLLIPDEGNRDGGAFRLYPAADFFSDRAVKAVNGIWFEKADD